ncbi:MAG: hypothetical protein JXB29_02655 [Sedimentisphaerales bacterium]|nr:hypothetical protein [Sedimentisphaerales bacterium]
MKNLPIRLFICPICRYRSEQRWLLARHLRDVHGLKKRDSMSVAAANEYLANPVTYSRVMDMDYDEDENND